MATLGPVDSPREPGSEPVWTGGARTRMVILGFAGSAPESQDPC